VTRTILIVEDDEVVSETLRVYLTNAGFAVRACRDGVDGLSRALEPDVDLVILDLMLPGLGGHEICRRLRAESMVPIVMLTARTSEDDRVRGLELGADDYVGKPFSPREVVARVQALLRRIETRPATAPVPITVGPIELDVWSREVRVEGRATAMTPTEFRLLEALMRQPGRTFTREELVARAFGPDYDGADRTIDTHVTNLRRKIEVSDTPRHLLTVHGVGYRLVS
jgi:DNA-binding response OmpR family regulator